MANFGSCIEWVLRLEDRTLSGVVKDLADGGGRTRFGITERWHPEATESFYKADKDTALEFAKDLYWRSYWTPINGSLIRSDELAATILSFAVNDGVAEAVKLLQRLLGNLTVDGALGARTRFAIEQTDSADLAGKLREAQEWFYRDLVVAKPDRAKDMKGWIRRAQAVYPDLP